MNPLDAKILKALGTKASFLSEALKETAKTPSSCSNPCGEIPLGSPQLGASLFESLIDLDPLEEPEKTPLEGWEDWPLGEPE